VVVEFTATLNVEKSVFLAQMQTSYKQGVADVSKVDVSQVTITSVTETRRRAGSISVATSVSAPASSGGDALKQNLASVNPTDLAAKISQQIEQDTGIAVTVVATKPVSTVVTASPQASSGPNAGVIGGAVGGSIGGIALVALGLWLFVKYRRQGAFSKESKEELITSLADTYTPADGSTPDASDHGRGVSSIRSSPGKARRNVNVSLDVPSVVSPRKDTVMNTPRRVMSNAAEKMRQAFYGIQQTSATDYVAEATVDASGQVTMESHGGPGKNKFMMFDSKVTHLTMKKDAIAKLHDSQGIGKKFRKKKVTTDADLLMITEKISPRGITPRTQGASVEQTLGGGDGSGIMPLFKRTLSRSMSGIKRTLSKGKIPKAIPEQTQEDSMHLQVKRAGQQRASGAAPTMSRVPDFPTMPSTSTSTSAGAAAGVGIPSFPTMPSTSAGNAAGVGGDLQSGSANVQRTDFKRNVLLQAQASGIQRVPSTGPRSPSSLLDLKAPLNPAESAANPAQLSVAPAFKAFSIEDATALAAAASPSSNKWAPAPVSPSGVHTVVRKGSVTEGGAKKEGPTGKFPDGTFNSLGDA